MKSPNLDVDKRPTNVLSQLCLQEKVPTAFSSEKISSCSIFEPIFSFAAVCACWLAEAPPCPVVCGPKGWLSIHTILLPSFLWPVSPVGICGDNLCPQLRFWKETYLLITKFFSTKETLTPTQLALSTLPLSLSLPPFSPFLAPSPSPPFSLSLIHTHNIGICYTILVYALHNIGICVTYTWLKVWALEFNIITN